MPASQRRTQRSKVRIAIVAAYVAVAVVFFGDYYALVRAATPDEIVDFTSAVVILALIALPAGIAIGRLWALAVPLIVFPIALVCWIVGGLDDEYSADAVERGGVVGAGWLGVAALVAAYAVPAAAFGVGLHALVRRARRS